MSKVSMDGHEPRAVWSWNLSTIQLVLGVIIGAFGVVGLVLGVARWSAGYVFTKELERFHVIAVPQIEHMIGNQIDLQAARADAGLLKSLNEINQRLARIEGRLDKAELRASQ